VRFGRPLTKGMVIDSCVVITESFNFTKAAEEFNTENLLVIRDEEPPDSLMPATRFS
jgi:phosphatidylserine/phosphatidylglycerophosphate/cardiolipin synthase-like enzyme